MSIYHLTKLPKKEIQNPILLLMLHGYGSNEKDLFSFAQDLPENLLIVSARAPLSLGYESYAWYNIYFNNDESKFSDIPEAIIARDLIAQFIDELDEKYHFDKEKSMMLGFSQGAILSYAVALTYPKKIKNILALSGYILEDIIEQPTDKDSLSKLDFYCSHGKIDPVISINWARKSIGFLQNFSIKYLFCEYNVGHGVAPENFSDLKNWILQKIN